MKIIRHWLAGCSQKLSPNHDDRPDENDITLIVIHCISLPPGKFNTPYIDQLFSNQLKPDIHPYFEAIYKVQVSTHILIRRNGKINQYVPFNKRAWHAGQSEYQGRNCCNDYSIGIELEGTETTPYTQQQYNKLARLINALLDSYPALSTARITGHSNIAPIRKTDPGNSFDWQKLFKLLQQNSTI